MISFQGPVKIVAYSDHIYRYLYWKLNKAILHRKYLTSYLKAYHVIMRLHMQDEIAYPLWIGHFEQDVYNFITRYLQPGMVFIDVGANVGLFSLVAASRVGLQGQVHAFEPSQREAERMRINVKLNHMLNITINPIAVMETPGNVEFAICEDNYGVFNAVKAVSHPSGRDYQEQIVTVPATTIDTYVEEHNLPAVSLLKIDVEGSELSVLRGASNLLSGDDAPALICEFSTDAAAQEHCNAV